MGSRTRAAAKGFDEELSGGVQEDEVTTRSLVQVAGRGAAVLTHGTRLFAVEPEARDGFRRALPRVVEVDVRAILKTRVQVTLVGFE